MASVLCVLEFYVGSKFRYNFLPKKFVDIKLNAFIAKFVHGYVSIFAAAGSIPERESR